jgi:hypothetical protein
MDKFNTLLTDSFFEAIADLGSLCFPQKIAAIRAKLTMARASAADRLMSRTHEKFTSGVGDSVPYAKPFRRLTNRAITGYDVVTYRDIDSLLKSGIPQHVLQQTFTKEELNLGGDEHKEMLFWEHMDVICNSAHLFSTMSSFGLDAPPTRDEIAENIRDYKRKKKQPDRPDGDGVTMETARNSTVLSAIHDLCKACAMEPVSIPSAFLQRCDADLQSISANGKTFGAAAVASDAATLSSCPCFVEWGLPPFDEGSAAAWAEFSSAIAKSYSLTQMQQSIPASMMQQIESQAASLASGMEDGDMSQLDLSKIGDSVLAGCSAEDLSQLAGNMSTLLPNLSGLASSLTRDAKPGDIPPEMATMLSAVQKIN